MQLPSVWLMPRPESAPVDNKLLSSEVLDRAATFHSERRRSDFLWARHLLTFALQSIDPMARMHERPPLTPAIKSSSPLWASISHTDTWIGVALSHEPIALDLEVIKSSRVRQALFERVFGVELWKVALSKNPVEYFYRAWGVYECAVKLQATFARTDRSYRIDLPDGPAHLEHFVLPQETMLTVAGGSVSAPLLIRVECQENRLCAHPWGECSD